MMYTYPSQASKI